MIFVSNSPSQTEEFSAKFAKKLFPGAVVALHGELGAGKTVFARGLAVGLGLREHIHSPTFVIAHEYKIKHPLVSGVNYFFHLDLYRLESAESAHAFDIEEYLAANNAVTLIEWAERIEPLLPKKTIKIFLSHLSEMQRQIRIQT